MTKRTHEEAFDIMSQLLAVHAKRAKLTDPPPLDTIVMQNLLIRVSNEIENVSSEVEHLTRDQEFLINKLAAYVGQDPRELWYQNDTGTVCDFLGGACLDLVALARKFAEWRRQSGVGDIGQACVANSGRYHKAP